MDSVSTSTPSLFDKLERVELTPTARIDSVDQNACDSALSDYQATLDEITAMERAVLPLTPDVHEGDHESWLRTRSWSERFIENAKREFEDGRKEARRAFVQSIVQHFEQRHGISLNIYPLEFDEAADLTVDQVLDRVLDKLGGRTFNDAAAGQLRAEFKRIMFGRVSVAKKTVRLPNVLTYREEYGGGYRLDYGQDGYYRTFVRALSHFEKPECTTELSGIAHTLPHRQVGGIRVDFSETYDLFADRITSVRFYKNGNIAITFPDGESAQAFVRTFDLLA